MAKDEKIGTVRYQYAVMAMLVTTGKNNSREITVYSLNQFLHYQFLLRT